MSKKTSLRKQFLTKMINVFLFITIISGVIQIYIINEQINYEMETQSSLIAHSIILMVSGFVSLLALFLITISFFDKVYENIQRIIKQIRLLERGDLTIKSEIPNAGELSSLSVTINIMVDKLNKFIKDTQEQANKTQKLSEELEEETFHSVEKIYELSAETTMKAREQLHVITEYLDCVEYLLNCHNDNGRVREMIARTNQMRELANERTAVVTYTTIKLADLLKSLYGQSQELSEISNRLFHQVDKFRL